MSQDVPARSEYQAVSGYAEDKAGSHFQHCAFAVDDSSGQQTPDPGFSGSEESGECAQMDIDAALERVGFGKYHLLLFVYSGLVWFSDALEVMLLSFLGPAATCAWALSPDAESALTSVVFLGMMLGAWFWGGVADSLGRKTAFAATAVWTAFFGVGSALASNYTVLIIFRGFVGFGLAGAPAQYTLFMEWLPPCARGRWLVLFNIWWILGSLLEATLALLVLNSLGWRFLVGISSIPMIFLVLLFPLVPDSPRLLLSNGHAVKAAALIRDAAKFNGAPAFPPGFSLKLPPSAPSLVCRKETHESCTCLQCASLHGQGRWQEWVDSIKQILKDVLHLFRPALAPLTLGLLATWFVNALSYYSLVMLPTELLLPDDPISRDGSDALPPAAPDSTGSSSSSSHGGEALHCVDGFLTFPTDTFIAAIMASFAELPGLAYQLWVVGSTTHGRHRATALSLHLTAVSLLPLWWVSLSSEAEATSGGAVVTLSLFFSRFFVASAFNLLYIFSPEVLPTRIRALGMGICNSVSRVGGLVAPLVAVELVVRKQVDLAVMILISASVLAGIIIHLVGWRTSGRELDIDTDGKPKAQPVAKNEEEEEDDDEDEGGRKALLGESNLRSHLSGVVVVEDGRLPLLPTSVPLPMSTPLREPPIDF